MAVINILMNMLVSSVSFKDKPPLLLNDANGIFAYDAMSWETHPVVGGGAYISQLDYHWSQGYLYYNKEGELFRKSILDSNSPKEELITILIGDDIWEYNEFAVDWVQNKLFWINGVGRRRGLSTLHVSNLDGTMRKTLAVLNTRDMGVNAGGMVLDPYKKYVYFVSEKGLERVGMDGSNQQVIFKDEEDNTLKRFHTDLAIDYKNGKVYFYNAATHTIDSVNTDGSGHKNETAIYSPSKKSLAVYQGNLYFIAKQQRNWDLFKRYDPKDKSVHTEEIQTIVLDYKIFHPFAQLPGDNPCETNNGGCSHLCLPRPTVGFTCECPDDYEKADGGCTLI